MTKHHRTILIASLVALAFAPSGAVAHAIAVDGLAGEWFATPAPMTNLGRIARRGGGSGEYVWRDALGDGRASWPAAANDLAELRVTGDTRCLYVLARLAGPAATSGGGAPQLRIAIDTDRFFGSGGVSLGDSCGFELDAKGAYEALLVTRFGSGQAPLLSDAWGGELPVGANSAISPDGVIEISLPWSSLGFAFVPTSSIRLAVALFVAGADDVPLDPADDVTGRAADVVAPCGAPGAGQPTATELADGVLDYSFDLWFDARGECIAPLLVHEVSAGAAAGSQWVEVVNATQGVVSLASFKVGDAESPQGAEGLVGFPSGTLLVPGETFVVARDGSGFLLQNAQRPDAECIPTDAGTRDMLLCQEWGAGSGLDLASEGDQVLVLDGSNTVLDVVTIGAGAYPGVSPRAAVSAPHTIQRRNPTLDSDDCGGDFVELSSPSPGVAAQITAVATEQAPARMAWAPAWPNPSRGRVSLALRLAEGSDVRVEVLDAGGRRVSGLHHGPAAAGELRMQWNTTDDDGRPASPGQYYVRAVTAGESRSMRVTVLR